MVLVARSIGVGVRGGLYARPLALRVSQRKGKLFRAPSALTLASWRGTCGVLAAAGIDGYYPLLATKAPRPCAGE
jgi:hypothetical protein